MSEKKRGNRASAGNGGAGGRASGPMDVTLLEQIVKLMAANDLNTVDVRDGTQRIVLKRGAVAAPPAAPVTYAPAPTAAPTQAAPSAGPAAPAAGGGASPAGGGDDATLIPIKAEMVGTFYEAAKPGEKAFVTVGSKVDEETPVCLIEAMKNYFPVAAGVRGTIAKILVQNGQTVQFDQTLFLVKPA